MRKEVNIGGTMVTLEANAATPWRFKNVFHEDLLRLLNQTVDDEMLAVDTISRLAYVMMMQAEGDTKNATEDKFIAWLEGFEPETFMDTDTLFGILGVYNSQAIKSVEAKKKPRKSPVK